MKDCWASAVESPETLPQPLAATAGSPNGLELCIHPWICECPAQDAAPRLAREVPGVVRKSLLWAQSFCLLWEGKALPRTGGFILTQVPSVMPWIPPAFQQGAGHRGIQEESLGQAVSSAWSDYGEELSRQGLRTEQWMWVMEASPDSQKTAETLSFAGEQRKPCSLTP